jgi:hypothetical protein
MAGMPTVPVYDLKIHPRDRELIAATHGRGVWIVDIAPLEQLAGDNGTKVVADAAYLFQPKTAYEYGQGPALGASAKRRGHKVFNAPSRRTAPRSSYRVGRARWRTRRHRARTTGTMQHRPRHALTRGAAARARAARPAWTAGADSHHERARRHGADAHRSGDRGLHRVTWDFRGRAAPRAPLSPSQLRDSVIAARRMNFVFDSLEKAGTMPKPALDRLRRRWPAATSAALFRGGGGGRGAPAVGAGTRAPVRAPSSARLVAGGGEGAAAGERQSG